MVEFEDFTFATPPYVGAETFLRMCSDVGLHNWTQSNYVSPRVDPIPKLYISMVRDPYYWLKAFYSEVGKRAVFLFESPLYIAAVHSPSFGAFVRHVAGRDGIVKRVFDMYTADSVIRFEDLPWNVIELFEAFDVPEQRIEVSKSKRYTGPVLLQTYKDDDDRELRKLILRSESELCQTYNYY